MMNMQILPNNIDQSRMIINGHNHANDVHLQESKIGGGARPAALDTLRNLASGNAVVIFVVSGCCMCHVVKQLLFGLGVGPTVVELDRHGAAGLEMHALLRRFAAEGQQPVPAVFVGGNFLGGIEAVMTCHINGTLVPLLKDAGALWL